MTSLSEINMGVPVYTLSEVLAIGSIVLSAGAYLFDFGSNMVVLVQYSTRYVQLSSFIKTQNLLDEAKVAILHHHQSDLGGYFFALLAVLVCCHSLNALLFKLKFQATSGNVDLDPIFAAYFLPLLHLYRLAYLVWRTFSYKGVKDLTCPLMNGLYCIIGSALEGLPMLVLQFCGYLILTQEGVFPSSMWTTLKVSVIASLLSAAYNGGTAAQSVACTKTSTMKEVVLVGATGAGVTLCATMVRCLTFVNIIIHIREHFSKTRSIEEQAKFHISDSIPLTMIGACIVGYTLFFSLFHGNNPENNGKKTLKTRLLTSLVFAYMSMMMGPLYAIVSDAAERGHLGKRGFQLKLLAISMLHLSVDIGVVFVTMRLGMLPHPYLIASLLGVSGYVGFLLAFIKVDVWRRYNTQTEEASLSLSLSPSPSPSPSWSSSRGEIYVHIMIPEEITKWEWCTKHSEERRNDKEQALPATWPTITHKETSSSPSSSSSSSPSSSRGKVCVHIMIPEEIIKWVQYTKPSLEIE